MSPVSIIGFSSDRPSISIEPCGRENIVPKLEESLLKIVRWTFGTVYESLVQKGLKKVTNIEQGILNEEYTASILEVIRFIVLVRRLESES